MTLASPVLVIGGGWAGLSAAVELARHDIPVTLLECEKQLGGRARRSQFGEIKEHNKHNIDNGQHLIFGAYDSTLSLLRTVGVRERNAFKRINLSLNMLQRDTKPTKFTPGKLPAPLHFAWGLLRTTRLTLKERLIGLQFGIEMAKIDFNLKQDMSCLSLLEKFNQSKRMIQCIWEPLCRLTLNTPPEEASANLYLRVIREMFSHAKTDSNLLLVKADLGSILPDPAMDYIERYGGSVKLGQKVTAIHISDNRISGVKLTDSNLDAKHVILATPYNTTTRLISPHKMLSGISEQLQQLESNPIITVYLQYPKNIKLGRYMVGMVDTTAQWLFDKRICGKPGLMAVVISGHGEHSALDNAALCDKIESELADLFPRWPKPQYRKVITEQHATFKCDIETNSKRPKNKSPVEGLWLAGDYTDTNLPATLESAVRSGIRSAHGLIETIK